MIVQSISVTRVRSSAMALTAVASFAVGAWLAGHHPLVPVSATVAFGLSILIGFFWPLAAFFALPAFLPLASLATWSGLIVFDEFDLLVLGLIAGRYAAMAQDASTSQLNLAIGRTPRVLLALFLVSIATSLFIGLMRADDLRIDWFVGYYDALNSLRIAKPSLLAALILVALLDAWQRYGEIVIGRLMSGCAMGLGLASFAVLWERIAFVGLFDFSSDYRVTGPFWEMHVGGAALDGYLVLTLPFAVREWINARGRRKIAMTIALMVLAAYACLSTFSRAVYIAVPISMAALALLLRAQRPAGPDWGGASKIAFKVVAAVAATIVAAWLTFRHGGYRALAAMVGVIVVALPLTHGMRDLAMRRWLPAALAGACLAASGVIAAMQIPKGPYALYGVLFMIAWATAWRCRRNGGEFGMTGAVAALAALVVAALGLALYWGGAEAVRDGAFALTIVAILLFLHPRSGTPLFRDDLRSQSAVVVTVMLLSGVVAVFSGGAYMEGRLSASHSDLDLRLSHWRHVIGLIHGPEDWWFGNGLGRFPARYFYDVDNVKSPGSYRLEDGNGKRFLVISGSGYPTGFGELLRVSQRIPAAAGANYTVTFDARSERDVEIQVELCGKHLLYSAGCAVNTGTVEAAYPMWHSMTLSLNGHEITGGPWYAPRLALFSMAVVSSAGRVEIDNVRLEAVDGHNLTANGDFAAGMSRWFFTSDRDHLPWHAQNMMLSVLFEQGIIGLVSFIMLVTYTLWRLSTTARHRFGAPFCVASLIGFLAVGVFDSLLDVPRVAFLFYLILFLGVMLPQAYRPPQTGGTLL